VAQIIKKATEWLVRDENGLHRFNTEEEAKAHAAGGAVEALEPDLEEDEESDAG
tara:strand:+ start:478 stop:639 length:162 start_codon:yes stop_codon:yes gene_type:complete